MVKMKVVYQGEKHCRLQHGPSGAEIETDAPKDNHGRGESFSPTDLVGAAFGSCILTTIAIFAAKDGDPFSGGEAEVEKIMVSDPRRIGTFNISIRLPATWGDELRKKYENIARNCPVAKSLHPDLKAHLRFEYTIK